MFNASRPSAQPPLDFLPPKFDPKVLWLVKTGLPLWMYWRTSIRGIEVAGAEALVELFHQFQADKVRFLIAFRHPSPEDAYCLMHCLWYRLPQIAQTLGRPFQQTPHAHFVYDRGIPLWAGKGVGWLYSRLGGTPIQRGKVDRRGLKSVRQLFSAGAFPLAAAPEGANNGHSEILSPLEPGIAQFGFWCVEDCLKAQRRQSVVIVPLGIQYRYRHAPWPALVSLVTSLEHDLGLSPLTMSPEASAAATRLPEADGIIPGVAEQLYPRLVRVGERLLSVMEDYYAEFFPASFQTSSETIHPDVGPPLAPRLHQLLNIALQAAESFFQLPSKGTVIDRCRRIEQAGWDWIYREELRSQSRLSPVERGLADRIAEEAMLRMWHMRLVESFVAVTGDYVSRQPTAERFAETLLLMRDTVIRIKGGNPFPRPVLGAQVATLTGGTGLSVSDRWLDYQTNRRQAVAHLTADLQQSLQALIHPHPNL